MSAATRIFASRIETRSRNPYTARCARLHRDTPWPIPPAQQADNISGVRLRIKRKTANSLHREASDMPVIRPHT